MCSVTRGMHGVGYLLSSSQKHAPDQAAHRRWPQVDFMRRHALAYEAVAGEEYGALKPALVKVQEAVANFAFAAEVKAPTSRDAFFKARA